MRRLLTPVWVALLVVFMVASVSAEDRKNPNVEKLGDPSSDVRAAAAQALGGG